MAKAINCMCGFTALGETADAAADVLEAHIAEDHSEMVGKVRREDLVAMAEEA